MVIKSFYSEEIKILPVVKSGTRSSIVNASLKFAPLWKHVNKIDYLKICVSRRQLSIAGQINQYLTLFLNSVYQLEKVGNQTKSALSFQKKLICLIVLPRTWTN